MISVHSISCNIHAPNMGIASIVCSSSAKPIRLACLSSPTGIKFIVTCDVNYVNVERLLQRVYADYVDWVMPNINYSLDMPIRIPSFEKALAKTVSLNAVKK